MKECQWETHVVHPEKTKLSILGESGRLDGLTVYRTILNEGTLNAEMTRTLQAGMRGKIVGNGTCLIATNSNYNEIAQK